MVGNGAAPETAWVTRVDRVWLLGPFQKQFQKRQRETALMGQLTECVDRLYENPRQTGLNLETLGSTAKVPVLSARIDRNHRLILTPLADRSPASLLRQSR